LLNYSVREPANISKCSTNHILSNAAHPWQDNRQEVRDGDESKRNSIKSLRATIYITSLPHCHGHLHQPWQCHLPFQPRQYGTGNSEREMNGFKRFPSFVIRLRLLELPILSMLFIMVMNATGKSTITYNRIVWRVVAGVILIPIFAVALLFLFYFYSEFKWRREWAWYDTHASSIENDLGFRHDSPYISCHGQLIEVVSIHPTPGGLIEKAGVIEGDILVERGLVKFYQRLEKSRGHVQRFEVVQGGSQGCLDERQKRVITVNVPM